ncbi:hypothetical protein MBM_02854 [Drepanopeziza brunnea f. sp. 'multigermtubi' MB_m1]|uniref:Uncharacterized protein n=1 Tax=Marssonina brunnea f. sp. multigermtubi (strain MB_m1) TaxID=1072389 RepID=K1X3N7_MARBU|nr:uncharacterized protein MBM_02854 [Drepanopeziza brunnea f. sp. 'multigermtubi' MB_m1]EKD19617.1 hypothetical protein MBM_02854 [Drepanopeziza brunnea f. sp. 'multigermtubi' MB_m1]
MFFSLSCHFRTTIKAKSKHTLPLNDSQPAKRPRGRPRRAPIAASPLRASPRKSQRSPRYSPFKLGHPHPSQRTPRKYPPGSSPTMLRNPALRLSPPSPSLRRHTGSTRGLARGGRMGGISGSMSGGTGGGINSYETDLRVKVSVVSKRSVYEHKEHRCP